MSFCSSQKQEHSGSLPAKYLTPFKISETERKAVIKQFKPVDLTRYLPEKYVTNGSVDYTEYLQKGIDVNHNVLLPDFPVKINQKGLVLNSNSNVIFNKKSKLIIMPNSQTNYGILSLVEKENITVYYANIEGDKYSHLNQKGEWGMGINILGSKNITIKYPKIEKCWGDGIYIDAYKENQSEHITIYKGILNDNRRNGLTIISGSFITIDYLLSANTKGTLPEAGIDIEPDDNKRVLNNITLNNVTTFKNGRDGILIALEAFVGLQSKKVAIDINNHFDDSSAVGLHFYNTTYKLPAHGKLLEGAVNVTNSEWINNSKLPLWYDTDKVKMPLVLKLKKTKSGNKSLDKTIEGGE